MATTRATAGRPETRTPDALATPSTPPAIDRRSTRERKQTTNFAQQQEEDSERRATQARRKRSLPSETLRRNAVVNAETDTNQSNAIDIQDLLAEVKSLREEISQNHIEHQEEIHKIRTEYQESLATVQQELEEIKNEIRSASSGLWSCDGHEELRQELRSLHSAITTPSTGNGQPTWASIVAGQNRPIGNNSRTTQNRRDNEANCLRISTQLRNDTDENGKENFGRYLPVEVANAHIREALSNSDTTRDARVAGVGTTATGYAIRFQDVESAETAKASSGWLQRLGNGTKLVRPRYGVVVHRTPTEDFALPGDEQSAITKIMEENGLEEQQFNIVEVAWLRRKDKPQGRFGSLAIWFDTPEAVEWMVQNGLIVGLRYIGSVEPYQAKRKRCHRCQRFGHLARMCQEKPRCGHCAEDHEKRNCPPGVNSRCLDCKGDHPTGDRRCQNPPTDE